MKVTVTDIPDDAKGVGGCQRVSIDGLTLVGFTPETNRQAVRKFVQLVEEQSISIYQMLVEYESKVQWNIDHPGQGKNWPVFNRRERLVKDFMKRCEIFDS